MRFVIFSKDKANSLHIRKANRGAHLTFLKDDKGAQVLTAGPWLNDAGEMAGSLLIVDSESRGTLDDWIARDPYAVAGLSVEVNVKPFIWVIGAPD